MVLVKYKTIGSILAVLCMVSALLWLFLPKNNASKENGRITIWIQDEHQVEVVREEITFEKQDTLKSILATQYDATFAVYGTEVLIGLNGITTTWVTSFFYITVNGVYSTKGIQEPLVDGSVYGFEVRRL